MVLTLAEAVRAIRKRQTGTAVEFAKLLGVSHSNVSRWETGDTIPTTERLLVLYQLAQTKKEKQVVLSVIRRSLGDPGPSEDDLRQVIEEVQRLVDQPPMDQGPATRDDMLVWFVNLWSKHSAEPHLLECFGEGLAYIDATISLKTGQHLPPGLKFQALVEQRFKDASPEELRVVEDVLYLMRHGDPEMVAPIVADARRTAAVVRKSERTARSRRKAKEVS